MMENLKIKCLRCGSDKISKASNKHGNLFAISSADENGVVSTDEFVFVEIDVCRNCGELSVHMPTTSNS